jgi:hypothetical protein
MDSTFLTTILKRTGIDNALNTIETETKTLVYLVNHPVLGLTIQHKNNTKSRPTPLPRFTSRTEAPDCQRPWLDARILFVGGCLIL